MSGKMMKKKFRLSIFGQLWLALSQRIHDWFEWEDAKLWANQYHPAWLALATSKKASSYTRLIYREKILNAYRGAEYV